MIGSGQQRRVPARPLPADDRHDELLAGLAAGGDVAAYEALVRRHTPRIRRTAYRVVGNREDAEDVAQDVLVTLWTSIGSYAGSAPFTTWLHRVVTNRALSLVRSRRPQSWPLPESTTCRPWDGCADVERAVLAREQLRSVADAVAALPASLRSVFAMHQVEGRSYQEVADSLALPEPTVRGRLARARRQLTARLGA